MHVKNAGKRPLTSKHGRGNGVAVRAQQNGAFSGMHVTKLLGTDFHSVSLTQPPYETLAENTVPQRKATH